MRKFKNSVCYQCENRLPEGKCRKDCEPFQEETARKMQEYKERAKANDDNYFHIDRIHHFQKSQYRIKGGHPA